MTTDVAVKTSPALALKGGLFTLTSVQIFTLDLDEIEAAVDDKIKQAPKFFLNTPVIVDLNQLKEEVKDLDPLIDLLKRKKLIPIGIRSISQKTKDKAVASGLAIMPGEKSKSALADMARNQAMSTEPKVTVPPVEKEAVDEEANALGYASKLITTPVRSGQQVYVPNGDLVVLNSVSQGAELLSEGNIHIHGPLRGRALAGINGNTNTIIYCKSLEAELVSIAGQYRIVEDLKESSLWKRSVCIQLKDNRLQIDAV